jgi:hypothetical protein
VLCDEETFSAASHDIQFDRLVPIPLKGIAVPVEIFRPLGKIGLTRGKSVKVKKTLNHSTQNCALSIAGRNHC